MLRRLRWKLTAVLVTLLAGVLIVALTIQAASAIGQFQSGTDGALRAAMERTQAVLGLPPGLQGQDWFSEDPELYTAIPAFCAVLDGGGRRLLLAVRFNSNVEKELVSQAVELAAGMGGNSGELEELGLRYLIQPMDGQIYIAFADLTWEREAIRRQLLTEGGILAAALLAAFAISYALSRWLIRPVERAWAQQRQFVADASHELKTPLTVLMADTDILLSHPDDTIAGQRKWLEYIRAEAVRMKELVQDLLFLARGDASEGREHAQKPVDLSALCQECALSFEPVAFEAGLTLEEEVAPDVTVEGSEEELRRLAAILLDNACKYGGEGGSVRLTLSREDREAVLSVYNTGDPIPPEAQSHLFERFYRADPARSGEKGGYGLGLSIAEAVVKAHRGKIAVHSAPEEGTTFTVRLPLDKKIPLFAK